MKKRILSLLMLFSVLGVNSQCFQETHGVLRPDQYWTMNGITSSREKLIPWINGESDFQCNIGSQYFLDACYFTFGKMIGLLNTSQCRDAIINASSTLLGKEYEDILYYGYIAPSQLDAIKHNGLTVYTYGDVSKGTENWKAQDHLRSLGPCDYDAFRNNDGKLLVLMVNHGGYVYVVWMAQCWNPSWVQLTRAFTIENSEPKKSCCGDTYVVNNYYNNYCPPQEVPAPIYVEPVYVQSLQLCSYWQPQYVYMQTSFNFYIVWDRRERCHKKIPRGCHEHQQQCNNTPHNLIPTDEPGQGPNGTGFNPNQAYDAAGQSGNKNNGHGKPDRNYTQNTQSNNYNPGRPKGTHLQNDVIPKPRNTGVNNNYSQPKNNFSSKPPRGNDGNNQNNYSTKPPRGNSSGGSSYVPPTPKNYYGTKGGGQHGGGGGGHNGKKR